MLWQVGPYLKTLLPLFGSCLKDDQDPALRISFLQVGTYWFFQLHLSLCE
jgi:hypothetical protein